MSNYFERKNKRGDPCDERCPNPNRGFLQKFIFIFCTATGREAHQKKVVFLPKQVQEVYIGNGFKLGVGKLSSSSNNFWRTSCSTVDCTTINKLEASGMKINNASNINLKCGDQQLMLGGMGINV
ncbi:Acetyl-CoA acetyltransferase, mitochondrial [Orchesella cincta]|uniref:Acetyl-CoA acetyltransferase, mitochondrial n=1 Tax=Orchesella cincta TaxID=48709 RepID=A0A1D2NKH4_ORCCI|nr:Acetyl-CoA acetyltransferase, mitochondrial [Orchesella cincta]